MTNINTDVNTEAYFTWFVVGLMGNRGTELGFASLAINAGVRCDEIIPTTGVLLRW